MKQALNTEEIMDLSLKLVGLKEVPEDSAIYVSARSICELEKKGVFVTTVGVVRGR